MRKLANRVQFGVPVISRKHEENTLDALFDGQKLNC